MYPLLSRCTAIYQSRTVSVVLECVYLTIKAVIESYDVITVDHTS